MEQNKILEQGDFSDKHFCKNWRASNIFPMWFRMLFPILKDVTIYKSIYNSKISSSLLKKKSFKKVFLGHTLRIICKQRYTKLSLSNSSVFIFLIIKPFQKLGAFINLCLNWLIFDRSIKIKCVFFICTQQNFDQRIFYGIWDFWRLLKCGYHPACYPYKPIFFLGKLSAPLNSKTLIKYF